MISPKNAEITSSASRILDVILIRQVKEMQQNMERVERSGALNLQPSF
jgi:hypothetical protein